MVRQLSRRAFIVVIIVGMICVWRVPASAEESQKTKAFTFVQLCDTQLGFGGYEKSVKAFKQAVEQVNALNPDFVVICGDLIHDPDDKSFADFKEIRSGLAVPCYCAAGNHDVNSSPTAASLKRYREVIGKDYFSFEHKGYTFVVANTQLWKAPLEGESQRHDAWVVRTLKEAKKKGSPVFVVAHYPLYLARLEEKDEYFNLPLNKRKELLTLYEQCGVVAVLAGHIHRLAVNNYKGIQLVNGEATSVNSGPLGFRLWTVASPASIKHEFVPLAEAPGRK